MLSPDKPSAPKNLRVKEVYKDFIAIAWDTPETDGGSPITSYIVEKRDASKTTYVNAGTLESGTLHHKVTKLVEGKEYYFRVYAENAIGRSDPAETTDPIKAKLPFGELCYGYFK